MPIASSETTDLSPRRGGYRARFAYTLTDGRVITRGPINVADNDAAETKRVELENSVLASVQKRDAQEAVKAGVQSAHKEATEAQVLYAWLLAGFDEEEHYKAYHFMKDIGPSLLSLGYTDEQYAVMLNTTVEDATASREYWEFLDANSATILAYGVIA
jgi:glutamate synthase domain-containing protein 3